MAEGREDGWLLIDRNADLDVSVGQRFTLMADLTTMADGLSDGVTERVRVGLSDGWVDGLLLRWLVRRLVGLRGGQMVGSVKENVLHWFHQSTVS